MDRVLVSLYIPSISETYDVYLPLHLQVHEIVDLIRKGLEQISLNEYYSSNAEILCDIDMGIVLSDKNTLAEYCIKNGDKLMFC
ncbi:MAG: hypothetical protein ACI4S2_04220 [Lachnospiraceae bacterium]